MPTNTKFCSKWLQNSDNTGRVNSRWLKQGKTSSSFQCIVCNSGNFSCTNGGWANLKRHFNRPKHIKCMKDVFDFTLLTTSNNQSLLLSKNKNDNSTCVGTGSIDRNTTRIPFVIVEIEQRALTHDDNLVSATKMLKEGSTRLVTVVNSKDLIDVSTARLLVTAANAKLYILKAQLLENSENLNRLRKNRKMNNE
ncbi:unnamed protein product [Adineta steineri]|uniref:Uncharacterized protein n=1 Tax=Adineta steineri TaxID=433720 RepID=A0A816CQP9_9BILA|nr:unnamed protein product [Adineta steineri]CAF1623437.1 unnamed protein product [Adineta steineri]